MPASLGILCQDFFLPVAVLALAMVLIDVLFEGADKWGEESSPGTWNGDTLWLLAFNIG